MAGIPQKLSRLFRTNRGDFTLWDDTAAGGRGAATGPKATGDHGQEVAVHRSAHNEGEDGT